MLLPKPGEIRKPTKTISGITPIAVMLPPRKCDHGSCVYCPNLNVPQSYTPKSPVVMRASKVNYDAFKQVKARLEAFKAMNHPRDKIELIIMGGTFLQYDKKFQYKFVKACYDALNNKISKTLVDAQKLNESSKHRCVALCIETRPDECVQFINRMKKWGATRVELGVQIVDDKIYKKVKRGHTVEDVVDATKALKNAGFKIGYHIMPGLLGSNMEKDLVLFKKLFSDSKFKPDQLKIYPCQVMPCSELERMYWKKQYNPYTKEQISKLLIKMLKIIPRYCRVMRIMREIPPEYIVAGTIKIDLRKDVEAELRKKDSKLGEIRYREIGFAMRDKREVKTSLKLEVTKYKASDGDEYFLEIVNEDDILFGLLRLRISKSGAIIREIHVYGQALKLGEVGKLGQHTGLGKWLMQEVEKIVKRNKIKKLSVISGVGVREYYRNLGYRLQGTYMVKNIKV
ncbi:MAG: tRNA uridine(34) 5-carboxymethylaminomethyl modification radical SAM/GNAT enzyme Elp3 [Nanoarchaeota archaeon]|nr:tRNA uridine(34) 5-carboxymethylaminomethyl modification radical SAM/GNAT enzyme Elp3 [Nanoarchaeota archaeon]MBU1027453.1 tRNA uridine(34) 5-carboxymethylaminomethyl modification radical SAM/GNAT enzyme Elp3 [Nanoarchaeota archaeon]